MYPVTAVQLEWSLWSRDVEAEVIPACRSLGIGIVPYSPLGRGVLTGTVNNVKVREITIHFEVSVDRFLCKKKDNHICIVLTTDFNRTFLLRFSLLFYKKDLAVVGKA